VALVSILNPVGRRMRLGEETRQALGMWPTSSAGGSLGASSRPITTKAVPIVYLTGYQSGAAAPTVMGTTGGGGRGPAAWERKLVQQV
jgi:hypothetical protein